MTEHEWLTSSDPGDLLDWLTQWDDEVAGMPIYLGPGSARKLRLFACACVRRVWDEVTDEWSRRAVIIAERCVDGLDPVDRMIQMHGQAFRVPGSESPGPLMAAAECCNPDAARAARQAAQLRTCPKAVKADLLREVVGNPFRPVTVSHGLKWCHRCGGTGKVYGVKMKTGPGPRPTKKHIFRPPEEVVLPCPDCGGAGELRPPAWLTADVKQMAKVIYDERAFDRLPVLADLMEQEGCAGPVCGSCDGRGWLEGDVGCPACGSTSVGVVGSGRLPHPLLVHFRETDRRCMVCCGSGTRRDDLGVSVPHTSCPRCAGAGRVSAEHVRGCWTLDLILGKE